MNIKAIRKKLMTITLKSKYSNKAIIYEFLEDKTFDDMIVKLEEEKEVYEDFTNYDQFIFIIDIFIFYICDIFPMLNNLHIRLFLRHLLISDYCAIFLEEKYYKDISNILCDSFDKIIITNFIDNIKVIVENLKDNNTKQMQKMVKLYKNIIDGNYEAKDIVGLLQNILLCNINEDSVIFLFKSMNYDILLNSGGKEKKVDEIFEYYMDIYYSRYLFLFNNYIEKRNIIKKLYWYQKKNCNLYYNNYILEIE